MFGLSPLRNRVPLNKRKRRCETGPYFFFFFFLFPWPGFEAQFRRGPVSLALFIIGHSGLRSVLELKNPFVFFSKQLLLCILLIVHYENDRGLI